MNLRQTIRFRNAVTVLVVLLVIAALGGRANAASDDSQKWVGTWASAQQAAAPADIATVKFSDMTIRQVVHVSVGGKRIRVRLSNIFGDGTLEISSANIALSNGGSSINASSIKQVRFSGKESVVIPAGSEVVSDSLGFKLPELANVAITVHVANAPRTITSHPGSRTTSYFVPGKAISSDELRDPVKVDHWYFIAGIDVEAKGKKSAIAILGDSITDGRGSMTNGNDRWPDQLSKRLRADKKTRDIAVLNMGIGGNRLLRDGLGPSAVSRVDRDVLQQPGVRWLIILEGVNDIGTRLRAREKGEAWASAEEIIAGYEQIIKRAHARGIKVYGATILPFAESFYATPDTLADRQKINSWIMSQGAFDGVIDLAKATCDPARPDYLLADFDTGDHLHLNPAGYAAMGNAIDLSLFDPKNHKAESASAVGN